jgi:Sulfatase
MDRAERPGGGSRGRALKIRRCASFRVWAELRGAPTPRLDQLASEGLRLKQLPVEPACTPSRAALMTGQYSIRNGLSLIVVEGSPYILPARAFTIGELFRDAGYATAIFGKWHLGRASQSLPTAPGFDEFYGIPPDISWDAATYVDTMELTHCICTALQLHQSDVAETLNSSPHCLYFDSSQRLAIFCARPICSGVILEATSARLALPTLNHIYERT